MSFTTLYRAIHATDASPVMHAGRMVLGTTHEWQTWPDLVYIGRAHPAGDDIPPHMITIAALKAERTGERTPPEAPEQRYAEIYYETTTGTSEHAQAAYSDPVPETSGRGQIVLETLTIVDRVFVKATDGRLIALKRVYMIIPLVPSGDTAE